MANPLSRLHLGAEARPPARGRPDRAKHPEYLALFHHRRGRVRHPRHLLDDRGGEDPGYRHPQGPRRV